MLGVKREITMNKFYLFISFRCPKIKKSNLDIFALVRFAFLSYRLLFQFINRNRHLLFCFKIITVIGVEL